jgi:hypothetical protein
MLDGQGFRGVRDTCKTLGSGFDRPYVGVCDRDLRSDDETIQEEEKAPGLFFLASRCLENELLDPPLLTRTLDMAGYEITEAEIRLTLRAIADGQYQDVHARMVDSELHRMRDLPLGREEGEAPLGGIRRKYEARREAAQNRLLAMSEVAARIEDDLQGRWDTEHLALLDGKTAMPQLAQQLAPGFKAVALRQQCSGTRETSRRPASRRCEQKSAGSSLARSVIDGELAGTRAPVAVEMRRPESRRSLQDGSLRQHEPLLDRDSGRAYGMDRPMERLPPERSSRRE